MNSLIFLLQVVSMAQQPIVLENRRELFVDDLIMESFTRMEIRAAIPVTGGMALQFNAPWEGRFSGGKTAIRQ